jgi:hypothetical protein
LALPQRAGWKKCRSVDGSCSFLATRHAGQGCLLGGRPYYRLSYAGVSLPFLWRFPRCSPGLVLAVAVRLLLAVWFRCFMASPLCVCACACVSLCRRLLLLPRHSACGSRLPLGWQALNYYRLSEASISLPLSCGASHPLPLWSGPGCCCVAFPRCLVPLLSGLSPLCVFVGGGGWWW